MHTLRWREEIPIWLDVAEFESALAGPKEISTLNEAGIIPALVEVGVEIYKGELLPSCFDDWIISRRERLWQAYFGALD